MFLSSLNGANVDMYKDDTDFCDLIATRVKAVGMPFDPKVLLEVVKVRGGKFVFMKTCSYLLFFVKHKFLYIVYEKKFERFSAIKIIPYK